MGNVQTRSYKYGEKALYLSAGDVYRLNNQYPAARECYEKALTLARERGDKYHETVSYLCLGHVCRLTEQYETSVGNYEKALTLARERKDKYHETESFFGLGHVYILSKKYQGSIEKYEKALTLAKEQEDKYHETASYTGLGKVYELTEQYQTAIENYEKVLTLARERGDEDDETESSLSLGHVYSLTEQYQTSVEYYEKALTLARKREGKKLETESNLGLGKVCRLTEHYQAAIENYEKALKLARERGYKYHEATSYVGLGEVYKLTEKYEASIETYGKALKLARERGDKKHETESRLGLGDVYRLTEQYQTAIENYAKALTLAEERGFKYPETASYLGLGDVYAVTNQHQAARQNYGKALEIAQNKGYKNIDIDVREQLRKLSYQEKPTLWPWTPLSVVHREKFKKLREYGAQHPDKVNEINGVRVCFYQEYLIGRGSVGTGVYIGLGKDGRERAVKRLPKGLANTFAERDRKILSKLNAVDSPFIVNDWFFDETCDREYAYLILDLYEETLEEYVKRNSVEHLKEVTPIVMKDVLTGLCHLHRPPDRILHRDLKPTNILRAIDGRWVLADFLISRVLKADESTYKSIEMGADYWRAVETFPPEDSSEDLNHESLKEKPTSDQVDYKTKSDIQVAGIVTYYVFTKGNHVFGGKIHRLRNLAEGKPVGLNHLDNPVLKDFLSWMLSRRPEDRPSASEALKHPYLQPSEQQFELLCNMGNQSEVRKGDRTCDVVRELNNRDHRDWRTLVNRDVLNYLCTDSATSETFRYDCEWTECLRLICNVHQRWKDRHPLPQPKAFYLVREPETFFLKTFPELLVTVYHIVRRSNWKDRPGFKELFCEEWPWIPLSVFHREKFKNLRHYAAEHPDWVKEIGGVRVCFDAEFVVGRGCDGTRVFIGLGKDGRERAVKRFSKDVATTSAEHERMILNKPNVVDSQFIVKYWFFDQTSDREYAYLILDLCEETLDDYVKRKSVEHLRKVTPRIMRDVLRGLKDLHFPQERILHRDLKPSNILRTRDKTWVLADFGISRILEGSTCKTSPMGSRFWRAVETFPAKDSSGDPTNPSSSNEKSGVRYKPESDIQVAGMITYYIFTKGNHVFGHELHHDINLSQGHPVGSDNLDNPVLKDFLSWMLSHIPEDRPSASEALKHPYLQTPELQFELLCIMGNQSEVKKGDPTCDVVRQLNSSDNRDWTKLVNSDVLNYLCTDPEKSKTFGYNCEWTGCLRFIRNVHQHWNDRRRSLPQPEAFYLVGEPQTFFLKMFPELLVTVYHIVRRSDWKDRQELKKFFE